MEKLGVVIFYNSLSEEELAALEWASKIFGKLSKKPHVRLLFVKQVEKKPTVKGDLEKDLSALVERITKKLKLEESVRSAIINKFDCCKSEFDAKKVVGMTYEGEEIKEILEGAIEEEKLDTLVLGGSDDRTEDIALKLMNSNSKCSFVLLAKIDPNPLKTKDAGTTSRGK